MSTMEADGAWRLALMGLAAVVVAVGLAACGGLVKLATPSPEGPRISRLEFLPAQPSVGCPVTMKVHLDRGDEGVTAQAVVSWVRLTGRFRASGDVTLPVQHESTGHVRASLVPERGGLHVYYVQIVDRAGRWSNVLSRRIVVDAAQPESCRDDPGYPQRATG